MKNPTDTIVCSLRYESRFTELVKKLETWHGFKVSPCIWCDEEYAYVFDADGDLQTIIIQGDKDEE